MYIFEHVSTCSTCCCCCYPCQCRAARLKCRAGVALFAPPCTPSQSHLALVATRRCPASAAAAAAAAHCVCRSDISSSFSALLFSHEANAARASSTARSVVGIFGNSEFRKRHRSRQHHRHRSCRRSRSLSRCLVITKSCAQKAATVFAVRFAALLFAVVGVCVVLCCVLCSALVLCPAAPSPFPAASPTLEAYTKLSKLEAVQFNLCVSSPSPS